MASFLQTPIIPESDASYIKTNEGFRDRAYKDTKGKTTIGYGFNIDDPTISKLVPFAVRSGARALTQAEADAIFNQLYFRAQSDARAYATPNVYETLSPEQQLALIDMAYNMGSNSLGGFENMRKALLAGDSTTAAAELMNSKYATKDVPNRAKRNRDLMLKARKK